MPNHIGKCSGPILNEYIDPIYEVRIHVALECEDGECEDGECEGYGRSFLDVSSRRFPSLTILLCRQMPKYGCQFNLSKVVLGK